MATSTGSLRDLSEIISNASGKIEDKYSNAGVPFPSLDDPIDPMSPGEALAIDPDVIYNTMLVIAAASQIISAVRSPALSIFDMSLGFYLSASLQAIVMGNIPEILREGGRKGVHSTDIAAKNGMNSEKISRLLRLLASHHVFREVQPDVWANNRISSTLDTLKPTFELFLSPENKHVGTAGLAALVEHCTDDGIKSAAALPEYLISPDTAHSDKPADTPWNRANNTSTLWFDWLQQPENYSRKKRWNIGMEGVSKLDDGEAILRGFPWEELPQGAQVVDVGGGLGSASVTVASHFPALRFVIQDLPGVIGESEKFWDTKIPDARVSGRVIFQGHDFFSPQPVKDVDVVLMRMISHDWPTLYVLKILRHLRHAATPGKTKLLIVDQIVPHAVLDTPEASTIPGAPASHAPDPLLPNFGKANSIVYLGDLHMMTLHQGQERTLRNHIDVTSEAGWKIVHIYKPSGSVFHHLVADAVE